jgi:hypothetical protein
MMLFGDPDRSGSAVGPSPFGSRQLGTEDGTQWLAGLLAPLLTFLDPDDDADIDRGPIGLG